MRFPGVRILYHIQSPKYRTEIGPIRAALAGPLDYSAMTGYLRAYPAAAAAFLSDRLCDDDFAPIARELYEYICLPDETAPAFEEWKNRG